MLKNVIVLLPFFVTVFWTITFLINWKRNSHSQNIWTIAIKEEYDSNFWQFINRKRIAYAKKQILQNPTLSAEALSEMCGFSHISAFSRAFRECEGESFRQWRGKTS